MRSGQYPNLLTTDCVFLIPRFIVQSIMEWQSECTALHLRDQIIYSANPKLLDTDVTRSAKLETVL